MVDCTPKWLLFDAADTLLRAHPSVADVYQRVAAIHHVVVDRAHIIRRFDTLMRKHFSEVTSSEDSDRDRWRRVVFDVLETDQEPIFDQLWKHFAEPSSWQLFDDVAATWSWLTKQGFQLAIASNFDARLLEIVEGTPPIYSASPVFLSSQLGSRKPSRQFFRSIEMELKARPNELMLIGDCRTNDYDGAISAGWQAYHLDRSCTHPVLPTISSLHALREILC